MIFAVYKPKGSTSHDIIYKLRKITGVKKIGHAGTLDPAACGVLVVGIGRKSTRKLKDIVAAEKEYIAKIHLGVRSSTDDEEGKREKVKVEKLPSHQEVQKALNKFNGKIRQIPPAFSAIKIRGKRAYKLAREGKSIDLKSREVEIKEIEILEYSWPYIKIRVVTGPGVYIRSLARDLGKELQTGGYLKELERIRVGHFDKKNALDLENINKSTLVI